MRLFLARKDDEWMTTSDTPDDSWLQNELDATKLIEDAFKFDLGKRVVHVLARLPAEVEAEAALAQVRKIRTVAQMRRRAKAEREDIEEE
ncbi:hypothetical protein PF008_g24141 [Phytophthora fragariae]|nr:hypothetical protein PF008_g24141 [Phytophthora fragariae]